jgi:hypothetical protein
VSCPDNLRDDAFRFLRAHKLRCRCGGSLSTVGLTDKPRTTATRNDGRYGAVEVVCENKSGPGTSALGKVIFRVPGRAHDQALIGWYRLD